jgi:hypothetical protein
LPKQSNRPGVLSSDQRGHPTDCEDRHCAQKLGQLPRCARIESAIRAPGQLRDLAKYLLNGMIVAFLEHKHWNAEAAEIRGRLNQDRRELPRKRHLRTPRH